MGDLDVFEIHGVAVRKAGAGGCEMSPEAVIVREGPRGVVIEAPPGKTAMSPREARRLARSLYRCARRIEARRDLSAPSPHPEREGDTTTQEEGR